MSSVVWRLIPLFVFAVLACVPSVVKAEYIDTFASDIEVRGDGSFTVTETIDYRFDDARHGIFREIVLKHPEKSSVFWKERVIEINLKEVSLDGKAVPYSLESTRDLFKVRIGDPDTTLAGAHTYTLTYEV